MKRAMLCVCALVVVGCANKVVRLPPEAFVTLGGKSAPYRAWAQVDQLCAVDANQFTSEQQALTGLLADWLNRTSAPAEGMWDDEHLDLLDQGAKLWPPALDLQQAALDRAKKDGCSFGALASARELNAQGHRRVAKAPAFLEMVRARQALAKWKDGLAAQKQTAHEQHCLTKMKPSAPILFFAWEDETGATTWSFCDGSTVTKAATGSPTFTPNPTPTKKPKTPPDPAQWLDLAAKHPADQISHAPKLPTKPEDPDAFTL